MRVVAFLELLYMVLLWIGLLCGAALFIFYSWSKKMHVADLFRIMNALWVKLSLMIGGLLVMTGGFGYARLRMPAEPLLVILSLSFWFWFIYQRNKNVQEMKVH